MAHHPTDKTRASVFALSAFGVTQEQIARHLGITANTLVKHYADELETASVERNAEVAAFLYRSASGASIANGASYSDCLKAAMFWLKTRAQWRETTHHELTGKDGGPLSIVVSKEDAEL